MQPRARSYQTIFLKWPDKVTVVTNAFAKDKKCLALVLLETLEIAFTWISHLQQSFILDMKGFTMMLIDSYCSLKQMNAFTESV